jgi:hypothetical protein
MQLHPCHCDSSREVLPTIQGVLLGRDCYREGTSFLRLLLLLFFPGLFCSVFNG